MTAAAPLDDFTPNELRVTCLDDTPETPVEWLWPDYFPLGMISLIAGDPGLAKSTVSLDFAARVSSGRPFPFTANKRNPGDVLIISDEDDPGKVIKPRLRVADATMKRIHIVNTDKGKRFSLTTGIGELAVVAQQCKALELIIIDPAPAFLSGENNSYTDVRNALAPLVKLAANLEVVVLLVMHLNKKQMERGIAMYRISGSNAWPAVARANFIVMHDRDDPDGYIFGRSKCNLTKSKLSCTYHVIDRDGFPAIEWYEQKLIDTNAALAPSLQLSVVDRAAAIMKSRLGYGSMDSGDLENAILEDNPTCSPSSMARARRKLGVVGKPNRTPDRKLLDGYTYELPRENTDYPDTPDTPDSGQSAQSGQSPSHAGDVNPNGQTEGHDTLAAYRTATGGAA